MDFKGEFRTAGGSFCEELLQGSFRCSPAGDSSLDRDISTFIMQREHRRCSDLSICGPDSGWSARGFRFKLQAKPLRFRITRALPWRYFQHANVRLSPLARTHHLLGVKRPFITRRFASCVYTCRNVAFTRAKTWKQERNCPRVCNGNRTKSRRIIQRCIFKKSNEEISFAPQTIFVGSRSLFHSNLHLMGFGKNKCFFSI